MAQHDYSIANQSGSAFRSDLNNALSAIVSQNSGTSSPSTTFAHQMWADTTNNVMKLRNAANDGWIELYQLDGEWTDIAFENGTAAAPSIYFKDSGTDTGFYSPAANQVGISTGGTSALVVDASQRVGIGTSSPSSLLHIAGSSPVLNLIPSGATNAKFNFDNSLTFSGSGGSNDRLHINFDGKVGIGTTSPSRILSIDSGASSNYVQLTNTSASSSGFELFFDGTNAGLLNRENGALAFDTNSIERARITSSGQLLVGTSSDVAPDGFTSKLQVASTDFTASLTLRREGNTDSAPSLLFAKTRSGSLGGNTSVNNGDGLGNIFFYGADGTDVNSLAARIYCEVDGTPGSNDMPGRLVFSTTADGASSPTERMRIKNNGEVAIGNTDANAGGVVIFPSYDATLSSNIEIGHITGTADGSRFAVFKLGSTNIGSITQSSSSTVAYNTSSDYRLKENVIPLTGAASRLNQLQVHRFNFIADPDKTVDGFIAHEAQAVVPECVTGTKDEVDDEGNPVYQGIDQSKLVPLLTAALQEALAEIESLKARLDAANL